MIIIAAVDEQNGMLFNHRRQSSDRVLREKILHRTAGSRLWMNAYSQSQFRFHNNAQITADDKFLDLADCGEFCFVETDSLASYEPLIEKIILCRWNRRYPADFYFDIDVHSGRWQLLSTAEFAGSSHRKITMEEYVR